MLVFDFNFALLTLLLITLGIKILGRHWLRLKNYKTKAGKTFAQETTTWLKIFAFFLIMRGFLIEPFYIPSSSMTPTLYTGDLVLINRLAFGLRLPVWRKKLLDFSQPQRGQIAVFHYPNNINTYYVKRIVGIPGDRIQYARDKLTINGVQITTQKPLGRFSGYPEEPETAGLLMHKEQNDNKQYNVIVDPQKNHDNAYRFSDFVVPENSYFVMGDNRDNSLDSRWWGVVPDTHLVGTPFLIWFNWGDQIDWSRIFTIPS